MARAMLNVAKTAKRGEIIEIKALIAHRMETGFRPGPNGTIQPRDIITRLVCTYNGQTVFELDLFPAMSANPYIAMTALATESGAITLTWSGDNGFHQVETADIEVV